MRGLIYKNIRLSFLAPKINYLLGAFAVGMSFIGISPIIGVLFFSFVVSTISTYCFYPEYKCGWNKYGNILPLKKWQNIAGKYLSSLIFVLISGLGGLLINTIYAITTQESSLDIVVLSMGIAIAFPVFWTSFFLPVVFKMGIQSVSYFRLLLIPAMFLLRNFTGTDLTLSNYLFVSVLILLCFIILGLSFLVTVLITGKRL